MSEETLIGLLLNNANVGGQGGLSAAGTATDIAEDYMVLPHDRF